MLREEEVVGGASPEESQGPTVARRGKKPRRHKRLPEVGVVHDVADRPLTPDVRHTPVEADPVADCLLVLAHRLGTSADVLAVRRREDGGVFRLAAELVHGVRGLAPVRVDEALLYPHRRTVVAKILTSEDFSRETFQSLVKASFETASRELLLERHVRVIQREEATLLVRPLSVVDDAAREVVVPSDDAVEEHRLLDVDECRHVRRRDGDSEP